MHLTYHCVAEWCALVVPRSFSPSRCHKSRRARHPHVGNAVHDLSGDRRRHSEIGGGARNAAGTGRPRREDSWKAPVGVGADAIVLSGHFDHLRPATLFI
jgi:hypothetical protein